MHIGILSDTHGRFDPLLEKIFANVELIIHAGDIGRLEIIDRLTEMAPVIAVEGNNDSFGRHPEEQVSELAGRRVLVTHIFGESHQIGKRERAIMDRAAPDIVVFGHSHRPYAEPLGHIMLFNPGSAGPKRFSLPRTAALLNLEEAEINWEIFDLENGKISRGKFDDSSADARAANRGSVSQAR